MDIYNFDINQLPPEQQAFFRSKQFQDLSPTAKIQVAQERLKPKLTVEQIEARKLKEHESMMKIYESRRQAEEARIEAARKASEERNRRIRGY